MEDSGGGGGGGGDSGLAGARETLPLACASVLSEITKPNVWEQDHDLCVCTVRVVA